MKKNFKNILIFVLGLAVLTGAGFAAWKHYGQTNQKRTFKTVTVSRGDISSSVTSTGTINPLVTVTVGTQVSGIIQELYVDYNSVVKRGQAIARIDPALFKAQVEQTKGAYLAAVANVAKARITLADAERTQRRYQALVRDGSVAVSDFDTAETARQSGQAALDAAEAAVIQTKGSYDQALTNLEYTTIRSPVDGLVISRSVDVGQTVAASFSTPTLFSIAQDLTKMQINASVDEADISKIRPGAQATFTVDAYPDERFTGVVTQCRNAAVTSSNVVTYVVVIAVDNTDLRLRPGMTTNVTFEVARNKAALKIPNAALRLHLDDQTDLPTLPAGEKRIFTLGPDGRPQPVRIRTGIGNFQETEVVSGELAEGAEVIVEENGAKKDSSNMPIAPGPRF